jgi:ribosomal protein S18 acetylase RimI-like enzyme
MLIRRAEEGDDEILVRHYRAIWESYGVGVENIKPDAEQIVREFIDDGRRHFRMAAFLAELRGAVVGSTVCQLHRVPYPAVTVPSFRHHGYIWHVFVEPAVRRQGIAAALVLRAIEHLRSIGCTTAVLHSSDAGKSLYERLGFQIGPEMRLDLTGRTKPTD